MRLSQAIARRALRHDSSLLGDEACRALTSAKVDSWEQEGFCANDYPMTTAGRAVMDLGRSMRRHLRRPHVRVVRLDRPGFGLQVAGTSA